MVGAIADWFAVTALFRHPLGLPIPHTALIPRRKDDLGRGLEEFVGENFLQEGVIRERVAAATISARVGTWLTDEANARRVVDEVADVAALGLGKVRDDHIEDFFTEALLPRFREEPVSPTGRRTARRDRARRPAPRDGRPRPRGAAPLAVKNPDTFVEVIGERAPWWAPPRLNEAVTHRIHAEAVRWVTDIRDDPRHHARGALDQVLGQLAQDLMVDPDTQARAERLKERVLAHPQVLATGVSLWNALRRALLASLDDPDGAVRQRLLAELVDVRRQPHHRRRAPQAPRQDRGRRRRLRRLPVRRRGHRRHHAHDRALGRQGGRPAHRAARRPRPPVHPDQRHDRRRPRRRAHPHRRACCSADAPRPSVEEGALAPVSKPGGRDTMAPCPTPRTSRSATSRSGSVSSSSSPTSSTTAPRPGR